MKRKLNDDERTDALVRANGAAEMAFAQGNEGCRLLVQEFKPERARDYFREAVYQLDIAVREFARVEDSDALRS